MLAKAFWTLVTPSVRGNSGLVSSDILHVVVGVCHSPCQVLKKQGVLPQLRELVDPLKQLQEQRPELFPKKGLIDAIFFMAKEEHLVAPLDLTYLSIAQHKALLESELYSDWMSCRFNTKVASTRETIRSGSGSVQDFRAAVQEWFWVVFVVIFNVQLLGMPLIACFNQLLSRLRGVGCSE